MDLDGELLWQWGNPGGVHDDLQDELPVQIHDMDGDGQREVIFFERGQIRILDGKTGEQTGKTTIDTSWEINSMIFGDLLGVGRDNCLVLSDRESVIMVLNEKLELLWQQELESGCQPMLYDIDNDQRQEVLVGYSVFDHQGDLLFDVGEYLGDRCNGVSVYELLTGEEKTPCLIYAAGDWGLVYFDFQGNLLKQHTLGHVAYLSIADFDAEREGLEIATSNQWGSDGLIHMLDATGKVYHSYMSASGLSRCLPVNWKGDGEEFFITNADSIMGGMYDGNDRLSVQFPSDLHPVMCYHTCDLTGDARDEILVWNKDELWIYTQEDNPRMGNTYEPHRIPVYNHSSYRMNYSLTGW